MAKIQFLKGILTIFIIPIYGSVNGQIVSAIISDQDGYTNVRYDSTINSEIIDKILDGEVFTYNGDSWYEQKNWIGVAINRSDNTDKCKYLSQLAAGGYMHRSRVLVMSEMPDNFERTITETSVELKSKNHSAKIEIRHLSKEEIDLLSKDGCIWGTDIGNPQNVISNVQLTINGTTVQVPAQEYEDLYRATLNNSFIKTDKNFIYLIMSNSSAAGFYEVTWVFKDGRYQRRFINTGP